MSSLHLSEIQPTELGAGGGESNEKGKTSLNDKEVKSDLWGETFNTSANSFGRILDRGRKRQEEKKGP